MAVNGPLIQLHIRVNETVQFSATSIFVSFFLARNEGRDDRISLSDGQKNCCSDSFLGAEENFPRSTFMNCVDAAKSISK